MQANCPRCTRVLEFSGERPRFCAYCGAPLESGHVPHGLLTHPDATTPYGVGSGGVGETIPYVAEARTATLEIAPDRIAGYRIVRAIGRGGMGTVYEAEESATGRKVALKLIGSDSISSPDALERFRQEGRLASTLSHPRCVFVLGADEVGGRPYIVMELMPGTTLQDVVEKEGPLAVESAVPKILDVIDGLVEAHRLGVIHRDVKPSNCFVEAEGRTKIGDFGLSKSLGGDSNLTRTGAFLGTPLYASPEQIKGEPIDARTDVYSVSATLYYLLSGKPPFRGTDAAATLARIVSEPLEPLRTIRPDIPAELERVIQRGMERDRARRYGSLQELRTALLPFAPGRLAAANPGRRLIAYFLDVQASKFVLIFLMNLVLIIATAGRRRWSLQTNMYLSVGLDVLVYLFSFAFMEAFTGASPAKWLMGLRVRGETSGPASPRAVWLRTLIYYLVVAFPFEIWALVLWYYRGLNLSDWVMWGIRLAWPLVLFLGASRANGYRGWHERLSGTRVVALPRSARRLTPERRRALGKDRGGVSRPVGVLKTIGPYKVRGAVRWEEHCKVLAAQDSTLGRESWIVLRPRHSPAPSAARRELARPGRLRWLAGGEQADGRWDAYVAPQGCPLADLAGPDGLPWGDARSILADLAEELGAAVADGTLPRSLTVDQIWIQPDGVAILVDPLEVVREGEPPAEEPPAIAQERALELLRKAAALALEGGRYRTGESSRPIHAAIPIHARAIIDRLVGGPEAYRDVVGFHRDLSATFEQTAEVDRTLRALQLAIQMALLVPGLAVIFGFAHVLLDRDYLTIDEGGGAEEPLFSEIPAGTVLLALGLGLIAIWILWSGLTRGGLSLNWTGLGLVRSDGQRAGRLRCLWRALLVWLLPASCLVGLALTLDAPNEPPFIAWVFYTLAGVSCLAIVPLALFRPDRGLHDRLAGTRVVPQ